MRISLYSPVPADWAVDPRVAAEEHVGISIDRGTSVGIVSNGKLAAFSDALAGRLAAGGAGTVSQFEKYYQEGPPDEALIGEIERLMDAALVGLGN
jgi:hypothetical protein